MPDYTEYRIGPAIVRIHGQVNMETLRAATERFVKQADQRRKEKARAREEAARAASMEDTQE